MDFKERIAELCRQKLAIVAAKREELVTAWIAETGLLPSQCELVEQRSSDGLTVTVYVRKRGE